MIDFKGSQFEREIILWVQSEFPQLVSDTSNG
jgi:hypothetical protein